MPKTMLIIDEGIYSILFFGFKKYYDLLYFFIKMCNEEEEKSRHCVSMARSSLICHTVILLYFSHHLGIEAGKLEAGFNLALLL